MEPDPGAQVYIIYTPTIPGKREESMHVKNVLNTDTVTVEMDELPQLVKDIFGHSSFQFLHVGE